MEALGLVPPELWPIAASTGGWVLALAVIGGTIRGYRSGRIVTDTQHLRELAQLEAALAVERAEKVMWRDAALMTTNQVGQLAEGQETTLQLLRGLLSEKKDTP